MNPQAIAKVSVFDGDTKGKVLEKERAIDSMIRWV
jgi:hypothetical protein